MAVYADLTPYSYLPTDTAMLNVGWLGVGSDFQRGPVDVAVIDRLLILARSPQNTMRGLHYCEFCAEESPIRLAAPQVQGGCVSLGSGELHVRSVDGVIYAAPTLVIHYILQHAYLPPTQFLDAVLAALPLAEKPGR